MTKTSEEMEALAAAALVEAVEKIGGQAKTARLLGVAQPSVWRWLKVGKPVPAEHVLTLQEELKRFGGPDRFDLRPDLYPRELRDDHAAPVDLEPAR